MDNKTKYLLIIGPAMFGFIFPLTTPTVQLYFIKLVDPQIFALSSVLTTALAAIINTFMIKDDIRKKIKMFFKWILLIDCIAFFIVSFLGLNSVTIRFIGISVLSATSVNLWMLILMDSINSKLSGDNLTGFNTLSKSVNLWSNLIGSILAVVTINMISIDICVALQCVTNCFCAVTDYVAYKQMS